MVAPIVYVGTYTSHSSEGIYVFRLDPASGELSPVQTVTGIQDPSYLAIAPDGSRLYAVNELTDGSEGWVSAFARDRDSGRLSFMNRVSSKGTVPAHLSVDPTGRWVLVANYGGGTIASFPLDRDGSLKDAADVVQHTGSGPNPRRQQEPHPHMIVTEPGHNFVLVPDLGVDRVLAYRLDIASGKLNSQPNGGGRLEPGSGPRHLGFARDGRTVYVINEIASTITVFDYSGQDGAMTATQTVSTLPKDYTDHSTTAAVVVHPNGRFVYGSNRGHDSIAAFSIDTSTGRLTSLGQTPTGGKNPRDFNIDPTGSFLLAANLSSDSITTFRINADSGSLEPTGYVCQVPTPARVLFAA